MTLEQELVAALAAGDAERAEGLAAALHARGFDAAAVDAAIAERPELEEQIWAALAAVIPLSRRAKKRRAIRAAERRDWGGWEDGQKG